MTSEIPVRKRVSRKIISSKQLADRARALLFDKLDTLVAKDLAALVIAELKLEEARARGKAPKSSDDPLADLRGRMRSAMSGGRPVALRTPEEPDEEEAEG